MSKPLIVIGNKNYSSWSMRAWLVLRESGLEFAEQRIPLHRPESLDAKLAYSRAGRVPVWIDGDVKVWDSLAIAETLAEQVPTLWPEDRGARARARAVAAEMHSGFPELREHMPMNGRGRNRRAPTSDALTAELHRMVEIWESCRAEFGADGAFLFGPFTIADAFFAPVVCRFVTYGFEPQGAAREYMQAVLERPSVREWLAAGAAESESIEPYEVGGEG